MAISETALKDAALMAIEEINQAGGILGYAIEPLVEDCQSSPHIFAKKTVELISQGVCSLFGCWTSSSRKAVLPIVEQHNLLLWYPLQYEGLEQSPNIFYTGLCPNQQLEPAVKWLIQKGFRRFYLLGSDYSFPRTAHKLVKTKVEWLGGSILAEQYTPLGCQSFESIIRDIQQIQPQIVFNTLNGDSNLAFYHQYHDSISATQIPIMAMSIAEEELQLIGDVAVGHYACWSYFQSIDQPTNHTFVHNFQNRFGPSRVTSDPIETAYSQIYLWKQAVEAAGSFDTELVRQAAYGQSFEAPVGSIQIAENHHVWKPCRIGQVVPGGQFREVYASQESISPDPWLGLGTVSPENRAVLTQLLSEVAEWIGKTQQLEKTLAQLQQEVIQRQATEQQLNLWKQAADASATPIVITDAQQPDLPLVCVNNAFEQQTGYTAQEVVGKNCRFLQGDATSGVALEQLRQAIAQQDHCTVTVGNYRKDGSLFWNQLTISPVFDLNHQLSHFLGVQIDITAQKENELELQTAIEVADSANKSKSQFFANISHELRTPLNGILGFSQLMLKDTRITPYQKTNLNIINRSGEHLLSLINDVLTLSKIEAGAYAYEPADVRLSLLCEELRDLFGLQAQTKDLSLTFHLDSTVPPLIKTDAQKLKQVLINLIGNALKFTEAGGVSCLIKCQPSENEQTFQIHFTVKDTGPGIPSTLVDSIFDPFIQNPLTRDRYEGTGLGLSICKKFVLLMGGQISLESQEGEGTSFHFFITAQPGQVLATHEAIQQQVVGLAPGQPCYRILVVDDHPDNRRLLNMLLQSVGFEVCEAVNGQDAIVINRSWQPHLIWMDLQMPILNGLEATQQIKAEPNAPIIIALTAQAFAENEEQALALGCDDFVRKPFKDDTIYQKIMQHLGVVFAYKVLEQEGVDLYQAELQPHHLETMPLSWVKQLHHAASHLDQDSLQVLIEGIPAESNTLISGLQDLLAAYQFETIMDITESVLEHETFGRS